MRALIFLSIAAQVFCGCTCTSDLGGVRVRPDMAFDDASTLDAFEVPDLASFGDASTPLDANGFVDASTEFDGAARDDAGTLPDARMSSDATFTLPDLALADSGPADARADAPLIDGGGGPCNLLTQDCAVGEGCYAGRTGPGSFVDPGCFAAGSSGLGGPCSFQNDCSRGQICLAGGADGICYQLCRLGGGAPSCPSGFVCNVLGVFDVGYCEVDI